MKIYRWSITSSIIISILSALLLTIEDFAYLTLAPRSNQSTCRILPSNTRVPQATNAPGPRLPQMALANRTDTTSMIPMPQRAIRAAPVPALHSLCSVGLPGSRTKGHGTALPSPGGPTNRPGKEIESTPFGWVVRLVVQGLCRNPGKYRSKVWLKQSQGKCGVVLGTQLPCRMSEGAVGIRTDVALESARRSRTQVSI